MTRPLKTTLGAAIVNKVIGRVTDAHALPDVGIVAPAKLRAFAHDVYLGLRTEGAIDDDIVNVMMQITERIRRSTDGTEQQRETTIQAICDGFGFDAVFTGEDSERSRHFFVKKRTVN